MTQHRILGHVPDGRPGWRQDGWALPRLTARTCSAHRFVEQYDGEVVTCSCRPGLLSRLLTSLTTRLWPPLAVALLALLMPLALPATEAHASQDYDRVTYTSGQPESLQVCHNWNKTSCHDGYWYLPRGATSNDKSSGGPGWSDTDGFRCPYGYKCKVRGVTTKTYGPGWHQLRGVGVHFKISVIGHR